MPNRSIVPWGDNEESKELKELVVSQVSRVDDRVVSRVGVDDPERFGHSKIRAPVPPKHGSAHGSYHTLWRLKQHGERAKKKNIIRQPSRRWTWVVRILMRRWRTLTNGREMVCRWPSSFTLASKEGKATECRRLAYVFAVVVAASSPLFLSPYLSSTTRSLTYFSRYDPYLLLLTPEKRSPKPQSEPDVVPSPIIQEQQFSFVSNLLPSFFVIHISFPLLLPEHIDGRGCSLSKMYFFLANLVTRHLDDLTRFDLLSWNLAGRARLLKIQFKARH